MNHTPEYVSPLAHKFGGSSLAGAEEISRVAELLIGRSGPQLVVVSAMKGVTDRLIRLVHLSAGRAPDWPDRLAELAAQHQQTADALLGSAGEAVHSRLDLEFRSLQDLLHAQSLLGAVSVDLLELVSGLGEVWSALLLHALLRHRGQSAAMVDARDVLVVEKGEMGAMVDWEESRTRWASLPLKGSQFWVVTGFVARTRDGRITTLGRNGSDYSGAIFAALTRASELLIWTDVDGVFSADPRQVAEAVLIPRLSYAEACELAYFGARVIHPQTMAPVIDLGIPIIIRNTFNSGHPGTRISGESESDQAVKGVTAFSGLAILTIEGAGLIGVPGTAERAFEALRRVGVSVVMISQGSSEHSICCVIREGDAAGAQEVVRQAFARERAAGLVQQISVSASVAAIAVVGDGMAGTPGVAARLFGALGRSGVNVRLIAQGSSERNISVAVQAADAPRALRAVHSAFYLSPQAISVGLIGPGNVGRALLRQIGTARTRLLSEAQVDLRVRAVAGRETMVLGDGGVDPEDCLERLRTSGDPADLDRFADHVQADYLPHSVIVDCSASDSVADRYSDWLARGIHVITPNKHAGSGPWERYDRIRRRGAARFRYESTVGAGLPVITTLRDLLDTGDEVIAIDGIFSGTLAYLFNRFDGTVPFSHLVRDARALGYTEPDPRDDLSGLDVARKLVILARENGWRRSLSDVTIQGLVPQVLQDVPLTGFLSSLQELDEPMEKRLREASEAGCVLRYTAHLDATGSARVGPVLLPVDHAFAHIKLTDNVIQFTTRRYRDNPLVIQGPGAGPEFTAAGVFADLLRMAASVGAPL